MVEWRHGYVQNAKQLDSAWKTLANALYLRVWHTAAAGKDYKRTFSPGFELVN